ncbi:MAG: hypothetical protein EOO88_57935, partial [Pedobacter sp.]
MSDSLTVQKESISRHRIRVAVSFFYFAQGLCFGSWASRIPEIKVQLLLSDAQLGSILLSLPLGQLLTMPFSGRLVTAFGSRRILTAFAPFYAVALTTIGLATTGWHLALCLLLFGIVGNLCNISLNTQSKIEKIVEDYSRSFKLQNIRNAAVVVIDNQTHKVVAYLGSAGFYDSSDGGQVNGAAAIRQPGSTLKPI